MFDRMSNGWELAKQSWHVLRCDKELLLFPVMSGIACLLVMATFAVPLWASGLAETALAEGMDQREQGGQGVTMTEVLGFVVLFAFYFVNYFVIVFFNSALVSCAVIRFKGGDPTLADGLAAASARLPQIAGWALLAATVGVILKAIESRSERVGMVVTSLLGMAWSIVTYFVVPVIVVERAGPVRALKRSTQVMKSTWGEALSANFGIGLVVFLMSLVAFIPMVLGFVAIGADLLLVGVAAIAIGVIGLLLISLVSSALNAIIIAALYLYAAEGTVPQQFNDQLFRDAFAKK